MAGTVHRLEAERNVPTLGEEHVLLVLVPMAGCLPEGAVVQQRRLDLRIATWRTHLAAELDQRVVDVRSGGKPEGGARRGVGEREQAQLRAELAVVVRACPLEALQEL